MKLTNRIKKLEKSFFLFLLASFLFIKKQIIAFFHFVINIGKQNITIMFIPHSEKKVFNIRLNLFLLFLFTTIITLAAAVTIALSINFYTEKEMFLITKKNVETSEKKAKIYENVINDIVENHSFLKRELKKLLSQLSPDTLSELEGNYLASGGPLNFSTSQYEENYIPERDKIEDIIKDYSYSIQAFSQLNKMAKNYNKLFKDIPFGSPVKGPYIFTSGFGFRIHPIHKVLDMHQGIDLAWLPGTPVVATAPGVVEKVEYNANGYGWYCKISHKLGFSTLYGHLISAPVVRPGDKVQKGQIIGYMGATGATTGVHVHYEVHLGGNLKDPWQFVIAN